jgi:muconolactone delta-isomerase
MAKELDTSWFDLKNYDALKTMSTDGWIWQLMARVQYHKGVRDSLMSHDEDDGYLLFIADTLKSGVIADDLGHAQHMEMYNWWCQGVIEGQPFSTASVDSLASYDLWRMAKDNDLAHVWEACEYARDSLFEVDRKDDLVEIADTPHDFHIKQYSPFDIESSAHVVVNLSATDEQIKKDFAHWLTHYRQAINYQHKEKLFTQVDFDYWVEYGVIPYLDLVLIAKIEGKKITRNKLGRLIFPDEYDVDLVERIRKTTKPTAEWLIKNEICNTLFNQLSYEKITGMKNA